MVFFECPEYLRYIAQNSREFIYAADFDDQGIIFYLANRFGAQKYPKPQTEQVGFVNLHQANIVAVSMSSILIGQEANLVSRTALPTCTRYASACCTHDTAMKIMPGSA